MDEFYNIIVDISLNIRNDKIVEQYTSCSHESFTFTDQVLSDIRISEYIGQKFGQDHLTVAPWLHIEKWEFSDRKGCGV
jgi:hypothetical protein